MFHKTPFPSLLSFLILMIGCVLFTISTIYTIHRVQHSERWACKRWYSLRSELSIYLTFSVIQFGSKSIDNRMWCGNNDYLRLVLRSVSECSERQNTQEIFLGLSKKLMRTNLKRFRKSSICFFTNLNQSLLGSISNISLNYYMAWCYLFNIYSIIRSLLRLLRRMQQSLWYSKWKFHKQYVVNTNLIIESILIC